ncbi:hypothetical protein F5Y08DRAFT_325422 [Xylaria arbuscula]|nr:hypothetical protein F5Y08DRAFT_325422 [Xylaria arbuscula]
MQPKLFLRLPLLPLLVFAFPQYTPESFRHLPSAYLHRDTSDAAPSSVFVSRQAPGVIPPFDAEKQLVSTKGKHAFVPPRSSDKRGPCPGLNALANHGYIPHNGVATVAEIVKGSMDVFGMGTDLATFLAIYGAVFDGDLTSFSIGGPPTSLLGLGNLLIAPQGLSGSHNKYEGDVSPIFGDLYQYGNNLPQASQFKTLYELGQENGDSVDLDILEQYRIQRFNQSVAENPYFFNAPFSGIAVSSAAYFFIYRFMGNKSAENPEGVLDGETLKSFYGVTGDYPDFIVTPGHSRIPDNWYKRHPVDYYTLPYLTLEALPLNLRHTQFLSVGGNTGTTNSFVGVDPSDLTNGVYNAASLLEGNNAFCFSMQLASALAPDLLLGLYNDITQALGTLKSAVDDATRGLGCPQLAGVNKEKLKQFPGYTKLRPDGTY